MRRSKGFGIREDDDRCACFGRSLHICTHDLCNGLCAVKSYLGRLLIPARSQSVPKNEVDRPVAVRDAIGPEICSLQNQLAVPVM